MQNPTPPRHRLHWVAGLLWALAIAAPARSADQFTRDTDFLRRAEDVSAREVASGRRAIQRSTRPDVVKAAEQLRVMGEAMSEQLSQLAVEKGWPMPMGSGLDTVAEYSDHEFIAHAIEVAQNALAFYKEEAVNGRDTDLQVFARRMVPEIERCLITFRALRNV